MLSEYLSSLSSGNLAVILTVSSSIPRKVKHCVGPLVLCSAMGTPTLLHNS